MTYSLNSNLKYYFTQVKNKKKYLKTKRERNATLAKRQNNTREVNLDYCNDLKCFTYECKRIASHVVSFFFRKKINRTLVILFAVYKNPKDL